MQIWQLCKSTWSKIRATKPPTRMLVSQSVCEEIVAEIESVEEGLQFVGAEWFGRDFIDLGHVHIGEDVIRGVVLLKELGGKRFQIAHVVADGNGRDQFVRYRLIMAL
jgi:hypothetical protein